MPSEAQLLAVRDLSVTYKTSRGKYAALRAVNLDVTRGTTIGIVGESGSGKSTLAAAILRLLPRNADIEIGSIRFDGDDLLALSSEAMRQLRGTQIAMVFQDPMTSLHPSLTIGSQMIDIQYRSKDRSRKQKAAKATELLTKVGISDPASRLASYPDELSGGMRQRVAIAMALLNSPELLIADEPTTALDVTMEAQIIHLLRELRREVSGSIIFISHSLGVIAELCEEVVVMYAGEIVEKGSVIDIFDRPTHPYTKALLACDPSRSAARDGKLATIAGDLPDLSRPIVGCAFTPRCPYAMETCRSIKPEPIVVGNQHVVSCHLASPGRVS